MSAKQWSSIGDVRHEVSASFGSYELSGATLDAIARRVWGMADHSSGSGVMPAEAWDALDLAAMADEIEGVELAR